MSSSRLTPPTLAESLCVPASGVIPGDVPICKEEEEGWQMTDGCMVWFVRVFGEDHRWESLSSSWIIPDCLVLMWRMMGLGILIGLLIDQKSGIYVIGAIGMGILTCCSLCFMLGEWVESRWMRWIWRLSTVVYQWCVTYSVMNVTLTEGGGEVVVATLLGWELMCGMVEIRMVYGVVGVVGVWTVMRGAWWGWMGAALVVMGVRWSREGVSRCVVQY